MAGDAWNNQLLNLIILSLTPGAFSGLFIYNPSPAAGNLEVSIAGQAGTDPFGNPYQQDIVVGKYPESQVWIYRNNVGTAFVQFRLNNGGFVDGLLDSNLISAGVAALNLQGPGRSLANFNDRCRIQLNTSDGVSSPANVGHVYNDITGADHTFGYCDVSGFNLAVTSQVTAANPTTGTSQGNVAVAETWHDLRPCLNGFNGTNAGLYSPQYRKCADGDVQIMGNIQTPATTGNYNNVQWGTLPVAYRPNKVVRVPALQVADGVATPVVSINPNGSLGLNFLPTSLAQTIIYFCARFPLDNTGVIQT